MGLNQLFWQGKRVLITGHTGFKGSWLSLWLQQLGADVFGLALEPTKQPSLFVRANVVEKMTSIHGDIRDLQTVKEVFQRVQPEIVIHLAAQALVRYSYQNPVETYQTNVMGSLHILEAIRDCPSVRSVVMVTTDKCYDNKEWVWPYRESDPMGGHDPYSSSKGCAELLIASYRNSFFSASESAAIASARAGNVIGGGDWSEDRLIPDIINAVQQGQTIYIRNPQASRPWQYVLEPLAGYLILAEKLFVEGQTYAQAWNFGPRAEGVKSVQWIVQELSQYWAQFNWEVQPSSAVHEAYALKLDSSKAMDLLGWQPQYTLAETLQKTVDWHVAEQQNENMLAICHAQIEVFNDSI